jgi:hypothetical protein
LEGRSWNMITGPEQAADQLGYAGQLIEVLSGQELR